MGIDLLTIFATGTGIAIIAGLGVEAPAVPPITGVSVRKPTMAMATTAMMPVAPAAIFQLRMICTPLFLFRRLRGFSAVRCRGILQASLAPLFDDGVEHGHKDERENGGSQHAAEYRGADGLAARGARAGRDHERHDAENEG